MVFQEFIRKHFFVVVKNPTVRYNDLSHLFQLITEQTDKGTAGGHPELSLSGSSYSRE